MALNPTGSVLIRGNFRCGHTGKKTMGRQKTKTGVTGLKARTPSFPETTRS